MLKRIIGSLIMILVLALVLPGCKPGDAGEDSGKAQNDSLAVPSDTTAADDSTIDNAKKENKKKKVRQDKGGDKAENKELDYVPVEVQEAAIGDIAHYLLLSASLKTEEQVAVYPETGGIIRQILTDEGDRVEEGDTLLIMDDKEKRIERDQALVTYKEREAAYQRSVELRKQNLISKEADDQAKFNLDRARLAYERAELELQRTRVLAPISGYIAARKVNRGDLINMQTQLYNLVDPRDLIAEVHVPEAELPRVDKRKRVVVTTDIYPGREFTAVIKRISPVVDAASGTFRVTIGVHNHQELLRPGIFVGVKIVTDVHQKVVLVPKQSVIFENDMPFVFIVHDSIALKLILKQGYDDNRNIEAKEYIKPGDKIVTVGQTGLKDSAKVKIIDVKAIQKQARELAESNGKKKE